MYHVELRQFPHNMSRFNISHRDLQAIVEPWARGQPVELGERWWSPHTARITILEGPEIPLGRLTMGRGWRIAEREGTDVTERVVAAARQALFAVGDERAAHVAPPAEAAAPAAAPTASAEAAPAPPPPAPADTGAAALGDPFALGMQMAALLGPDAIRLLHAWRAAAAESPGLPPSDTLARAEAAIRTESGTQG